MHEQQQVVFRPVSVSQRHPTKRCLGSSDRCVLCSCQVELRNCFYANTQSLVKRLEVCRQISCYHSRWSWPWTSEESSLFAASHRWVRSLRRPWIAHCWLALPYLLRQRPRDLSSNLVAIVKTLNDVHRSMDANSSPISWCSRIDEVQVKTAIDRLRHNWLLYNNWCLLGRGRFGSDKLPNGSSTLICVTW